MGSDACHQLQQDSNKPNSAVRQKASSYSSEKQDLPALPWYKNKHMAWITITKKKYSVPIIRLQHPSFKPESGSKFYSEAAFLIIAAASLASREAGFEQ